MTAQIKLLQTENAALHAEIADLHAQLEAVGAGGVGVMMPNAERKSAATLEPFGYFKAEPFGWTDCAETDEGAIALYASPQPHQIAEPSAFRPMSTAPRDATIVRLLVDFDDNPLDDTSDPVQTIGHNNFDHDGEDRWQFAGWCWSHDCYTEGKGTPIGWLPFQMEPS